MMLKYKPCLFIVFQTKSGLSWNKFEQQKRTIEINDFSIAA